MKKNELIKKISELSEISEQKAKSVLDNFVDVLKSNLMEGKKITLYGLGTWEVYERQGRRGVNPRTREIIEIPAKKAVRFKASRSLSEKIY